MRGEMRYFFQALMAFKHLEKLEIRFGEETLTPWEMSNWHHLLVEMVPTDTRLDHLRQITFVIIVIQPYTPSEVDRTLHQFQRDVNSRSHLLWTNVELRERSLGGNLWTISRWEEKAQTSNRCKEIEIDSPSRILNPQKSKEGLGMIVWRE